MTPSAGCRVEKRLTFMIEYRLTVTQPVLAWSQIGNSSHPHDQHGMALGAPQQLAGKSIHPNMTLATRQRCANHQQNVERME
jgi:hypothetical protein